MKTTLLLLRNILSILLIWVVSSISSIVQAQSVPSQNIPELVFSNPVLVSGTAGSNGAVYKFPDVTTNIDALVTISDRSSSLVTVSNIDMTSTGHANAFQPQISYNNGNAAANTNWWMDFDFVFVNKGTTVPVSVNSFNLTAIDVDGDGSRLHEYVAFLSPNSYLLESNTLLSVQDVLLNILNILTAGKQFDGPVTNFANIDVTATQVMTTVNYINKSSFRLRAGGGTIGGSSSVADRMYSFWFKGFDYNVPVQVTLPIKLSAFNAVLGNNSKRVDLSWTTAYEKNVSHFIVERSTDGINYSDVGMVFAYGTTTDSKSYSMFDNITNVTSTVIYYRLRSIDIDGKNELSNIRMIRIGKGTETTISILTYPNPVTNDLRITIPANWQNKKAIYEIFNANGQVAKRVETGSTSQTETINISSFAPGFYIVKVSCNGETAQQRVVKQ